MQTAKLLLSQLIIEKKLQKDLPPLVVRCTEKTVEPDLWQRKQRQTFMPRLLRQKSYVRSQWNFRGKTSSLKSKSCRMNRRLQRLARSLDARWSSRIVQAMPPPVLQRTSWALPALEKPHYWIFSRIASCLLTRLLSLVLSFLTTTSQSIRTTSPATQPTSCRTMYCSRISLLQRRWHSRPVWNLPSPSRSRTEM